MGCNAALRAALRLSAEEASHAMLQHLLQDLPPDVAARLLAIFRPPPGIGAHGLGGGDKSLDHGREVALRIIEAEDQASSADPTERQAVAAQIVLQTPMVAARLRHV